MEKKTCSNLRGTDCTRSNEQTQTSLINLSPILSGLKNGPNRKRMERVAGICRFSRHALTNRRDAAAATIVGSVLSVARARVGWHSLFRWRSHHIRAACRCIVYESKGYRTTWNVERALSVGRQVFRCDFIFRSSVHVASGIRVRVAVTRLDSPANRFDFCGSRHSLIRFISKCEYFFVGHAIHGMHRTNESEVPQAIGRRWFVIYAELRLIQVNRLLFVL